jgi:hypothetical protein
LPVDKAAQRAYLWIIETEGIEMDMMDKMNKLTREQRAFLVRVSTEVSQELARAFLDAFASGRLKSMDDARRLVNGVAAERGQ